jgi:type VI secretion system protein VasG
VPLSDAIIRQIVELQLRRVGQRLHEAYHTEFSYQPALVDAIAARCTESSAGARNIEHILSRSLLPELSAELLARLASGTLIGHVSASIDATGAFQYLIS